MELRHLRYFCAVADHGSFSRAAAVLRVAQPSLSRQVRDLEREVGTELLMRSSTGVRLTDAGEAFHQQCTRLLAQLAIAISTAQEVGRGQGGEFVIGGDWRLPMDLMPVAVMNLRKRFPRVDVRLIEMPMHEHLTALRERRIHLGFIPEIYLGAGDALETRLVLSSDIVCLLPDGHPLSQRDKLRVVDLQDEVWLTIEDTQAPGVRSYYQQLFRLAQISPRMGPRSQSVQGVVTRVASGEGISMFPRTVVPKGQYGVTVVPMDMESFEIYAVWPKEGASPLVAPFIELLDGNLSQQDGAES